MEGGWEARDEESLQRLLMGVDRSHNDLHTLNTMVMRRMVSNRVEFIFGETLARRDDARACGLRLSPFSDSWEGVTGAA
jgi:hypothetical protein